ncbi:hypothetical protein OKW38_002214 [Paraburkholderia sp. MM5496-R1]|uniref:hypothetical protein n=1 Tax=Paraburkholderia sp. MM5496-R1 TaxID=2991065 RepID=UPI003D22D3F4
MDHFTGPLSVLASGAVGATLRMIVMPPASLRLKVTHIVLGGLMAVFVAPAVVEHWLTGSSIDVQRGVAFLIGMLGPVVAEIAIRAIERRGDGVADRLIDRAAGTEDKKS